MNQHHDRDRKIFEVFVRENEGALMAYIRTFTRDAQIAEDLFQETMLIAWRKFDEFDSTYEDFHVPRCPKTCMHSTATIFL